MTAGAIHGAGDLPVPIANWASERSRWGASPIIAKPAIFLGRVQRSNSAVVAASATSEAETIMTLGP